MDQVGFYFTPKKCTKCHACEIACKLWNEIELGPRLRRVVEVSQGQYPDICQINVSLFCMHCGDAPCIKACPVHALSKSAVDGRVTVEEAKCIGCTFCTWACPFNAPQLGADGKMVKCDFCPDRPLGMPRPCEEVCATGALLSGTRSELDEKARQRSAKRLISEAEPSFYIET
jgi:anaerobic dimethyl sulfoxide reductase subunit B (iron-sulfur subunit)